MSSTTAFSQWFFSERVLRVADLPRHLLDSLDELPAVLDEEAEQDLVAILASELLSESVACLPDWIGPETRYLLVLDIPEPAMLRVPTILGIHKPDQRVHATRDPGAVKRLAIALHRSETWEGIVDAYPLQDNLVVVLGDLTIREFPKRRLPRVGSLEREAFADFRIDDSGSYLHWPGPDVHLGPSQMLQATDPMYLADVEIRRYAMEKVSLALRDMRRERELRQSDIAGLSERHVRRLEKEDFRLTVDAAQEYADAFGQSLLEFLDELSRRVTLLRDGEGAAT